jgi:hypothetical protein
MLGLNIALHQRKGKTVVHQTKPTCLALWIPGEGRLPKWGKHVQLRTLHIGERYAQKLFCKPISRPYLRT